MTSLMKLIAFGIFSLTSSTAYAVEGWRDCMAWGQVFHIPLGQTIDHPGLDLNESDAQRELKQLLLIGEAKEEGETLDAQALAEAKAAADAAVLGMLKKKLEGSEKLDVELFNEAVAGYNACRLWDAFAQDERLTALTELRRILGEDDGEMESSAKVPGLPQSVAEVAECAAAKRVADIYFARDEVDTSSPWGTTGAQAYREFATDPVILLGLRNGRPYDAAGLDAALDDVIAQAEAIVSPAIEGKSTLSASDFQKVAPVSNGCQWWKFTRDERIAILEEKERLGR